MMHRVYKQTAKAYEAGWDWDKTIAEGEIETVEEFATIEEAEEYFQNELGGDCDTYGVE